MPTLMIDDALPAYARVHAERYSLSGDALSAFVAGFVEGYTERANLNEASAHNSIRMQAEADYADS